MAAARVILPPVSISARRIDSDSPQPLCAHSSAVRIRFTLPAVESGAPVDRRRRRAGPLWWGGGGGILRGAVGDQQGGDGQRLRWLSVYCHVRRFGDRLRDHLIGVRTIW